MHSPVTGSSFGWAVKVRFWVFWDGLSSHPAAEVPGSHRRQRRRVQLHGALRLLQGQKAAAVPQHGGVGGAVVPAGHGGVVGKGVAVGAEQGPARRPLERQLLGAHVARLQVGMAVLEAHHVHHAVAVEEDVGAQQRRVLRVGAVAHVGAVQAGGDLAFHLQVIDIHLHPHRCRVAPVDEQVGKLQSAGGAGRLRRPPRLLRCGDAVQEMRIDAAEGHGWAP
jgi:hypothetical protein